MKYSYTLEIDSKESDIDLINTILGIKKNFTSRIWRYCVTEHEKDDYYDFINNFLDLLEGKYEQLRDINIQREDITIWMIYYYYGQCNMEFDPQRMKRLGDNGIKLCISCYQEENPSEGNGK